MVRVKEYIDKDVLTAAKEAMLAPSSVTASPVCESSRPMSDPWTSRESRWHRGFVWQPHHHRIERRMSWLGGWIGGWVGGWFGQTTTFVIPAGGGPLHLLRMPRAPAQDDSHDDDEAISLVIHAFTVVACH